MPVLQAHLGLFFRRTAAWSTRIRTANRPTTAFCGIEGLLPYAVLVHVQPNHGALDLAARFARSRAGSDGVIDGANTTTEGCYTLAYPLAAIARAKEDAGLGALALHNLVMRKERLTSEDAIYQRAAASGEKGFRNWSRGVAWYLLGLVRVLSLIESGGQTPLLRAELTRAAEFAIRHQQLGGLWFCYLDDPATGLEASGSAGIAAAVAGGAKAGLLPGSMLAPARKAWQAMTGELTPDGYLANTAQNNKGGEELQRGGYRVISPYARSGCSHN
jgi:unsaturated rhamnogalacturonyl hydrolase